MSEFLEYWPTAQYGLLLGYQNFSVLCPVEPTVNHHFQLAVSLYKLYSAVTNSVYS